MTQIIGFILCALIFQIVGSALSVRAGLTHATGLRSDYGLLVGMVALIAAFCAGASL
jgi:hypothetical protein